MGDYKHIWLNSGDDDDDWDLSDLAEALGSTR